MKNQKRQNPHLFFLERDSQYPKGFPDTLPLPDDFLSENEFFKPKEVVVDWEFYAQERVMSSKDHLPIEDNQLILKKWLSDEKFHYEYKYDDEEEEEMGRIAKRKKRRRFEEIKKIKLKTEEVICERVKASRSIRPSNP